MSQPPEVSADYLAEQLDQHATAFHGSKTPASEQLFHVKRLFDQACVAGLNGDKAADKLIGSYMVLTSALLYKNGQYEAAGSYANTAIKHGGNHHDIETKAHGYIRFIQNECWNGKPKVAARVAAAGMYECWDHSSAETQVWLASHAMRAFAMTGDRSSYAKARLDATEKLLKLPNSQRFSAFSFMQDQFTQAVAVGEMFIDPKRSLSWFERARQLNPPNAVHVNTLDSIHEAGALFRMGAVERGYEFLRDALVLRANHGTRVDRIYKDRAQRVLALIPTTFDRNRINQRTYNEVQALVST